MNRKERLLKLLKEGLEALNQRIIAHEDWANDVEFKELIDEAKRTAEMIRIIEEESGE